MNYTSDVFSSFLGCDLKLIDFVLLLCYTRLDCHFCPGIAGCMMEMGDRCPLVGINVPLWCLRWLIPSWWDGLKNSTQENSTLGFVWFGFFLLFWFFGFFNSSHSRCIFKLPEEYSKTKLRWLCSSSLLKVTFLTGSVEECLGVYCAAVSKWESLSPAVRPCLDIQISCERFFLFSL